MTGTLRKNRVWSTRNSNAGTRRWGWQGRSVFGSVFFLLFFFFFLLFSGKIRTRSNRLGSLAKRLLPSRLGLRHLRCLISRRGPWARVRVHPRARTPGGLRTFLILGKSAKNPCPGSSRDTAEGPANPGSRRKLLKTSTCRNVDDLLHSTLRRTLPRGKPWRPPPQGKSTICSTVRCYEPDPAREPCGALSLSLFFLSLVFFLLRDTSRIISVTSHLLLVMVASLILLFPLVSLPKKRWVMSNGPAFLGGRSFERRWHHHLRERWTIATQGRNGRPLSKGEE